MTTVMIVEDEFIVAQDLAANLTDMGYEVGGCFESGDAAMRQAQEDRPDLVIMDIMLKGDMDGIETAQKMNQQWGIPIVFLTAFANQSLLERAKLTEPFGYLIKPYNANELKSAIEIGLYKASMQNKLRKSEKRFRNMADLLPSVICEADVNQRIRFINKAGQALFKVSAADVERGICLSDFVFSDDRIEARNHFDRVLKGQGSGPTEFRMKSSKGTALSILVHSTPISENGERTGIRTSFVDITERKKLQSKLKQIWKMEAIATLAGGIAHEFNNALTVITGSTELLKSGNHLDIKVEELTEGIMASVDRMSALTNQMLAYARGGKYAVQSDSLNNFVREAFAVFEPSIPPDVQVHLHLAKDTAFVKADPSQFQFVLNALLTNACEALQNKGVVRIKTQNAIVGKRKAKQHLGLEPGQYASFQIRDNGPGMDGKARQGIFEPFFSTKFPGRGMGMAAVYGIVKNHQGWIGIDSKPGEGTQVTVLIPAIKPIPEQAPRINDKG
jgi:two-component system, cell cycle sensor histidine kinase and response regulator CckA